MPTYNDEKHIASSIQSVLNQTHTEWELLIMNDGSKDNTEIVVTGFNDPRIKYFRQENKGIYDASGHHLWSFFYGASP
jgi:glycosyltransferase involved in cell wall biosynthesis